LVTSWTGGRGDDRLTGAAGGNILDGGSGNDRLTGGGRFYVLADGDSNDLLFAIAGIDLLDGGNGADHLRGGTGRDFLTAGGGAGVFIFATAAEAGSGAKGDHATDFLSSQHQLDFSGFIAGGSFIGGAAFAIGGGPQVRHVPAPREVQGDVTGDGIADFSIWLDDSSTLGPADTLF